MILQQKIEGKQLLRCPIQNQLACKVRYKSELRQPIHWYMSQITYKVGQEQIVYDIRNKCNHFRKFQRFTFNGYQGLTKSKTMR